jgi:hypothetical protein
VEQIEGFINGRAAVSQQEEHESGEVKGEAWLLKEEKWL